MGVPLPRQPRAGHTRIFFVRFTTSRGATVAAGTATDDCTTYTAPPGWQIAGFHGRSGDEVDKLGVLYTRR
ncbi:jacalin-like lectin [Amycolatopsis australiensis]|uniref:jacalin-like lectin n=1 Tax=Amycolatopsis australiensis TaxID=546364 RepID=UPI0031833DAB